MVFRGTRVFSGHGWGPASKSLPVTEIIMDDVLAIEWDCKTSNLKNVEYGSVTLPVSAGCCQ